MTYTVQLRTEVNEEVFEAASWYESQQSGLGQVYLDNLSKTLVDIRENPLFFPKVKGDVHRALVSKFPFGVYFFIQDSTISVIAVMHSSRHPRNWQNR